MMTETTTTLAERIARVMGTIKSVERDAHNKWDDYRYASADAVYDALRPLLAEAGLRVDNSIGNIESISHRGTDFLILPVTLWLTDGVDDTSASNWPVPLQTAGKKGVRLTPQMIGAAVTYAEKYYLRAVFCLATGEPDADADKEAEVEPEAATPPPAPVSLVLDGLKITTDQGETLLSWAQDGGRAAQTVLYKFLTELIADPKSDAEAALTMNLTAIKAIIPSRGRSVLAGMMESAKMGAEIVERMKSDGGAE